MIVLCERCHQKDVVVAFTQIVGNEKKTLNLCKSCADEGGLSNPLVDLSKVFGKIIVTILGKQLASKKGTLRREYDDALTCTCCGCSWGEFQESGRLGCAACYDTFKEPMNTVLRRLHGNNRHIGTKEDNVDRSTDASISDLRNQLKRAVETESYESAAELRDHIRKLERKKSKSN